MQVESTRGGQTVDSLKAVLQGIATDGGLFVPVDFPKIDMDEAIARAKTGYSDLCAYILSLYFDLDIDTLSDLSGSAYAGFDVPEVAPLRMMADREYVLELTHGPTLAFKDMALQVLPRLTQAALTREKDPKNILILTATSGDTGKAALEGFKDVNRTAIFVFYPETGVSQMQKLQMVTQTGFNTGVCAVAGNFDDAQTGVKRLFADQKFQASVSERGYSLSSANSINFGRLVPQIAYYVYSYARLRAAETVGEGEKINFCVPTGNFGNILAAYYARRMGTPIDKLICASNSNNVLTEFFATGTYNAKRDFHKTMSPSMDILISSNLERLIFEIAGRDPGRVKKWMKELADAGSYHLDDSLKEELGQFIWADWLDEEGTAEVIRKTFAQEQYLMDPHTAVAQGVFSKYRAATGDQTTTVVVSTASPFKFPQDVLRALTGEEEEDAFRAADSLAQVARAVVPRQIAELKTAPVVHEGVSETQDMGQAVTDFIARIRVK